MVFSVYPDMPRELNVTGPTGKVGIGQQVNVDLSPDYMEFARAFLGLPDTPKNRAAFKAFEIMQRGVRPVELYVCKGRQAGYSYLHDLQYALAESELNRRLSAAEKGNNVDNNIYTGIVVTPAIPESTVNNTEAVPEKIVYVSPAPFLAPSEEVAKRMLWNAAKIANPGLDPATAILKIACPFAK